MTMQVRKAVIPAAGLGTRFLPITRAIPKEMLAILDRPTLHYNVEEAIDSGITDILVIISEHKDAIKNYFSDNPLYDTMTSRKNQEVVDHLRSKANFTYVNQQELNGNGGAIMLAEEFINGEPFAVLFGDDLVYNPEYPCTKQLIDAYYATGKSILGVQERPSEEAIKYGVIKKGKTDGRLTEALSIVEKPDIDKLPSNLCSLGRFILTPEIFDALRRAPLFKNEIFLTLGIDLLIKEQGVFAYNFEGRRYDIGDKFGFIEANIEYALRSKYGDKLKEYLKDLAKTL